MQDPKAYAEIEKKLAPYKLIMGSAADTILHQEVSLYPIFVIAKDDIELGIPLATSKDEDAVRIHASTLEELAAKRVVEMGKVDHFREIYKDPADFLCLFVINAEQASFIFIPRVQVDN